ncbi:uncharacterized protein PV09_09128 [Verruconis gallopava]|uniref:Uncharacterized protein n=1 Tax=Verruconis gallopava TaxID=253628 RepID=A0A0D1ZYL3_9PEZI|nr:uncharacterized protein PV09_09128 [Verruconis gallopava]KIV99174.1 hypothetical protein PV09_09128 [Verruconis gallopava]
MEYATDEQSARLLSPLRPTTATVAALPGPEPFSSDDTQKRMESPEILCLQPAAWAAVPAYAKSARGGSVVVLCAEYASPLAIPTARSATQ